ncbi:MAG: CCA tRNA nucleotidyltransferase [Candidatus Micrarchaeia archaeon]|jgi:tRNA nucleotidyltransferase (CCA-adding enzyme)
MQQKQPALEKLFKTVAEKVSPPSAEREAEMRFAAGVSKKLERALGGGAKVKFVGSAARDTGLRGDRDIDLFAVFPTTVSRERAVKKTFSAAKKAIKAKWITRYAEHPYLQTTVSGYKVEVIPCFAISPNSPLKSAVDRSPLHMDYLQSHLSEDQKRDVRVLKQLLKNNGIYGAELEVEGFSGLVCEQLVLNYHSLAGLLEGAGKWTPPAVIDIENAYEGNAPALLQKFPNSPLILVDAVDKNRNAAAATSATSVSKFICLSRELLQRPRVQLFFSKPAPATRARVVSAFKRRSSALFLVKSPLPNVVEDVLFPQLKKSASAIAKQLSLSAFRVYDYAAFPDEKNVYLLFELEEAVLPAVRIVQGPPASNAESVGAFVKGALKNTKTLVRGPYIKGGRVFADKLREEREAKGALKKIISRPEKSGVASFVAKSFKAARLFEGKSALAACSSPQALRKLGEYLLLREKWI